MRRVFQPARLRPGRGTVPKQRGASAVEMLLALPVLLVLGLGALQMALIYQARHALEFALTQAARGGAVAHAEPEAIMAGLAEGITPWLTGASSVAERLTGEQAAASHLAEGVAAGWLRLEQRSPTHESFSDWAVQALDPMGDPIAGLREIPNDNLDSRRRRQQPTTGVAGFHDDEPVGQASGQSLADANVLRLEMTYGMRLVVPVVGRWIISTLAVLDGCGSQAAATRLGLVRTGPFDQREDAATLHCPFYAAGDDGAAGRLPIRLSATVRMMSTARPSELTLGRRDTASHGASLGIGRFTGEGAFAGEGYDGSDASAQTEGWQPGRAGTGSPLPGGTGGSDNGPTAPPPAARPLLPEILKPPPASRPGVPHPAVCPAVARATGRAGLPV